MESEFEKMIRRAAATGTERLAMKAYFLPRVPVNIGNMEVPLEDFLHGNEITSIEGAPLTLVETGQYLDGVRYTNQNAMRLTGTVGKAARGLALAMPWHMEGEVAVHFVLWVCELPKPVEFKAWAETFIPPNFLELNFADPIVGWASSDAKPIEDIRRYIDTVTPPLGSVVLPPSHPASDYTVSKSIPF